MAKSEMFSPEEIQIIQTRQLRKTLHYAYERSPFYRDMMDRDGITPADIKSLADLHHLPTTGREDMIREGDRFLCIRPEEVVDVLFAAQAGSPDLSLKLSEIDLTRLAYNEQISLRVAGLTEKDVVALGLGMDRCSMDGVAAYFGLRRLGATILRLGALPPASFIALLERSAATAVIAPAAYLRRLSAYAGSMGQSLRRTPVRRLIGWGDPVRQADLTLNAFGQTLARSWDARPLSAHGSIETATTFCECEEGQGCHLHPELMHVEIVDEHGHERPIGEIGEVCITPFGLTGMPTLRYRTGELSFLRAEPCACGRATPRLGPWLGRKGQALKCGGEVTYPNAILDLARADLDVRNHVLLADPGDAQSDRLTLLIECEQPQTADRLQERLRQEFGFPVEVRRISPEELRHLQPADELQMPQDFLDRRHAAA